MNKLKAIATYFPERISGIYIALFMFACMFNRFLPWLQYCFQAVSVIYCLFLIADLVRNRKVVAKFLMLVVILLNAADLVLTFTIARWDLDILKRIELNRYIVDLSASGSLVPVLITLALLKLVISIETFRLYRLFRAESEGLRFPRDAINEPAILKTQARNFSIEAWKLIRREKGPAFDAAMKDLAGRHRLSSLYFHLDSGLFGIIIILSFVGLAVLNNTLVLLVPHFRLTLWMIAAYFIVIALYRRYAHIRVIKWMLERKGVLVADSKPERE